MQGRAGCQPVSTSDLLLLCMQDHDLAKQEKIVAIAGSNPANIEMFTISEQVPMCLLPQAITGMQTSCPGRYNLAGSMFKLF